MYKGFWRDVPVAIKFMLSSNPDHLNEKYREAILARFVSHPNVVQVGLGLALCTGRALQCGKGGCGSVQHGPIRSHCT